MRCTNVEQSALEVVQNVRAKIVELQDSKGGFIQFSCIVARETNPPAEQDPVEWRLLTYHCTETFEDAVNMID